MFTGLIEAMGTVLAAEDVDGGLRLRISVPAALAPLRPGDSLAVDGVCLTVTAGEVLADGAVVNVDLGSETLRRTTLGRLVAGARVNLERPVAVGDRLGGHIVQGHVDGVGTVTRVVPEGEGRWMEIALPPELVPYVAEKGSVAVDGVSLTVAAVGSTLGVSLIPYTLRATTLGAKGPGDPVNVEVDVVAKYVARLLGVGAGGPEVEGT